MTEREFLKKLIRKMQKHHTSLRNNRNRFINFVKPELPPKYEGIRQVFTKQRKDYFDSWKHFYLVETPHKYVALQILKEHGIACLPQHTDFYSDYDCTGKSFISYTKIVQQGNMTLVKVSWALDV